jgi:anaerobic magnesium-protoporphyrin IX monomethyl ester cyclase
MTVALIYPPACDPTAPYLSVPLLAGYLRARGVAVLPLTTC